ncbi:RTA1 like protein [Aspergillus caelatus]|uniref:RTA1 like protein n=1 Tax=Aspergillus caelatus TaxID=61420 RepID=A0A5N7ABS8_9EURO|nr:RTA1 like protein [Aspergillus caelatus]KAE8366778.1 RTA1 like protein [Aspergillus caelatus]
MGLYDYVPSFAGAVTFAVLFSLTTVVHAAQLWRSRAGFLIPFLVGGLFEVFGYITRAFSAHQAPNYASAPAIAQTLLILVAPSLFAASIYMVFGRIIVWSEGELLPLFGPAGLPKCFSSVILSLFCSRGCFTSGERLIKIGLVMQVIFFGLFLFCAAFFHFRIRRHIATHKPSYATPWQSHLLVLYIASVMVFVRSSFRLAEYVGGQGDVLLQHEYYIWIFDTTLMSLTMLLFNVFYPLTYICWS